MFRKGLSELKFQAILRVSSANERQDCINKYIPERLNCLSSSPLRQKLKALCWIVESIQLPFQLDEDRHM